MIISKNPQNIICGIDPGLSGGIAFSSGHAFLTPIIKEKKIITKKKTKIKKYLDNINNNRALGELDHPDSSIINLKNVSHNIKKIWWDGDQVMGAIEILPTPSGNILKALFANNIPVGVSSRGMGSLRQMGDLMEVQDDFELLCWDFVSTPSNPGSYMKSLNEGKNNTPSKYYNVNSIITDILCANGTCPIF
jgi:hypothetical protein